MTDFKPMFNKQFTKYMCQFYMNAPNDIQV